MMRLGMMMMISGPPVIEQEVSAGRCGPRLYTVSPRSLTETPSRDHRSQL